MRHLLHLGLFALALTAVSQASADHDRDDDRRSRRGAKIIVTSHEGPRYTKPVRVPVEPSRQVYDSRRKKRKPPHGLIEARRNLHEQKKDLEEITQIARRWERATVHRNPHAQRNVERHLDAWIERELHESRAEQYNYGYTRRLRVLRDELHTSNGRYVYGRGRHRRDARKTELVYELVRLSDWQLRRAEARAQQPIRMSFAYR